MRFLLDNTRMKTFAVSCAIIASVASGVCAEAPYQFRERLECVHRGDVRDPSAKCGADELEIKDGFAICLPKSSSDFVRRVARDFEDFLSVSMGVDARVTTRGIALGAENSLSAGLVSDFAEVDRVALKPHGAAISVGSGSVSIQAQDERALAQALYHLEDVMGLRGGPFLRNGTEVRTPRFETRMTHSGYGNDIFPDEHLNQMAHYGMTAILVFLDDIDKTKAQDYQDIKALIRRAARYGLDTYLYSYIRAFAHPADGMEAFNNSYGRIAGYYPEAKGIILVGESCQFPSRDPRVQPVLNRNKDPRDPRPAAGWFPCTDYPDWVRAVKAAIGAKAPEMELVFWTYNWGWAPYEDRMKLIDNLPRDITLMATFEMFERRTLSNGIDTPTADYSISFPGPGKYFVSEAERAKRNSLRLYTQANAGGLTWDYGSVPYQPLPQQWRKRWDGLVAAHSKWGLSGIMENHHFGWWPSFVAELEKEVYTEGGIPFDRHLRMIAERDFGPENASAAIDVWDSWSRRHSDYSPSDMNQYGTFRIGPAYPFTFGGPTVKRKEFPGMRYASNWPAGICRMDYLKEGYVPQLTPERMDNEFLAKEIELLEPMAAGYSSGAAVFARMAKSLSGRRRENALEMANLGEYFAATTRTAINVKRGAIAYRNGDRPALLEAARAEYANALAALPLVERDSRLGWEPSMEYCGGPEQIRWKLGLMEKIYGREAFAPASR